MIYDRISKAPVAEKQYKGKQLELLYGSVPGRVLLRMIFVSRWFSKLCAIYYNSKRSAKTIDAFVEDFGIKTEDFESRSFSSFNDFFTRRLRDGARQIDSSANALISPCDAKVTAYKIDNELQVSVKNSVFGIQELLRSKRLSASFAGGDCLVFRLTADDCHRYIHIDDGCTIERKKINGVLHTVRPIAFAHSKVYCENSREYALLKTESFGICAYVEVGAMLIGKIRNNNRERFMRGDEKGFFEYGGSTVILLFEKDKIRLDADIAAFSAQGAETKVHLGERIGCKC